MFTLNMVFLGAAITEKEGKKSARLKFHEPASNEVFEFYTKDEGVLKNIPTMKLYQPHAVMLKLETAYKSTDTIVRFLDAQVLKITAQA